MTMETRDAALYRARSTDRKTLAAFFNLVSSAVTYGMVMSSARTGLGTALPTGDSIPGQSLYYQALHGYSAFDWQFQKELLAEREDGQALPEEIALLAAHLPAEFVDSLEDEELAEIATAQRIACAALPSLKPFAFRKLSEESQSIEKRRGGVQFGDEIRDALWTGTRKKLERIAERAGSPDAVALEEKLVSMAQAFAPLCTVYAAKFDNESPEKSFTRLRVYLPALHALVADDPDDPSGWYVRRGFSSLALPAPLQVRAAQITHASYLENAVAERQEGVRLEVRRNFTEPQNVELKLGFGHYFASSSEELLGFETGDPADALHLELHGHVPVLAGDSERTIAAKSAANRALEGYRVIARVHSLTLRLLREEPRGTTEEKLLRPQFSLEESKLSFRIERRTTSKAERVSLSAAGFSWEECPESEGYLCWREFYTWDRLREFFGGEGGGGLGAMLVTGREKLLGQVIGRATKIVLDHSIESIEESLDEEIARLIAEGMERYATARDVLAARLHEGLF